MSEKNVQNFPFAISGRMKQWEEPYLFIEMFKQLFCSFIKLAVWVVVFFFNHLVQGQNILYFHTHRKICNVHLHYQDSHFESNEFSMLWVLIKPLLLASQLSSEYCFSFKMLVTTFLLWRHSFFKVWLLFSTNQKYSVPFLIQLQLWRLKGTWPAEVPVLSEGLRLSQGQNPPSNIMMQCTSCTQFTGVHGISDTSLPSRDIYNTLTSIYCTFLLWKYSKALVQNTFLYQSAVERACCAASFTQILREHHKF